MPIPRPSGETEEEYIGKCMSAIGNEYDDQEQALAICYNTFREGKMSRLKHLKGMIKKS